MAMGAGVGEACTYARECVPDLSFLSPTNPIRRSRASPRVLHRLVVERYEDSADSSSRGSSWREVQPSRHLNKELTAIVGWAGRSSDFG